MSERITTRVERLEARFGIGADDEAFMATLSDEDAATYRRIMRRPGSGDFERFLRTLPDDDLRTLHAIHVTALAADGTDIDAPTGQRSRVRVAPAERPSRHTHETGYRRPPLVISKSYG